jgi:hypothetical protein
MRRYIGPQNRIVVWIIWAVTAFVTLWMVAYVVGLYLGEVGH